MSAELQRRKRPHLTATDCLLPVSASRVPTAAAQPRIPNAPEIGEILIDTHNQPVHPAVWALYCQAIQHLGPIPTLIEWDSDLPELAVLVGEAQQADAILEDGHARAA